MQSDSDPHNTRTPGYFRFCAVQQAACDPFLRYVVSTLRS
jgi:hypothetical protein